MKAYPHLAARIFNTPLLIHPQKLDAIIAGLGGRLIGADTPLIHVGTEAATLAADLFSTKRGARAENRGYQVKDGVAVIRASGALVHRSRLEADSSYLLGYNDLAADVEDAMANADVHAVLLEMDSPGGEAQGAFELSDRLFDLRGKKPLYAIADSLAASAAYLAGSAADEFLITNTGYAGSIGVVMRHVDFSAALASDGIRVTHIFAGAHKVDGNPYEPLPAAVRDDMQAEIDGLYTLFVDAVARNRRMDAQAVRNTQARTFRGVAAKAAGLADRISTVDALITELAGQRARSYPVGQSARATAQPGETLMSDPQKPAGTTDQPAAGLTQADLDRARAEGVQEGASAERARVSAILGHEAASCSPLALQCIGTGLTIEQSTAILGAAPKAAAPQPAAAASGFAAAMAAIGNPDVSGLDGKGEQNDEAALAASILAAFRA